jgi:sugar lactone lactonase YvrE
VEVAPDGALWSTTSNRHRGGDAREGGDRILRFPPPLMTMRETNGGHPHHALADPCSNRQIDPYVPLI